MVNVERDKIMSKNPNMLLDVGDGKVDLMVFIGGLCIVLLTIK